MMRISKYARMCFQRMGFKVARIRTLPWGENIFTDIAKLVDVESFHTVLDVGANVGQSCEQYLAHFPRAKIYSFEPVSVTFARLLEAYGGSSRVVLENAALGQQDGQAEIYLQEKSTQNSLKPSRNLPAKNCAAEKETIRTISLDGYLERNGISIVDFLKIDTEGYEKEVLKGSTRALSLGRIRFIQLELGFRRKSTRTVFYNDIQELLSFSGYEVVSVYDQAPSRYSPDRFMMHANVLFIHQEYSKTLRPAFVRSFE